MNIIESRVNSLMTQFGACVSRIDQSIQNAEDDAMDVEEDAVLIANETINRGTINANPLVVHETGNASNVPDFTKNTIIYCRVSTQGQELDAQIAACQDYCIRNGYYIVEIITEKGSAFTGNQPNLTKILTTKKNINLLVYSIDRFSRNIQSCDTFITLIERNNINLKCVKENINLSTALGKHNFRHVVSLAQYESELIGERIKNNIRYKRQNNLHIGQAPYGFTLNKETKKLERNVEEQYVVAFVRSFLNKSMTVHDANGRLYGLLRQLNRTNDYAPIEVSDDDDQYTYYKYKDNDRVHMSTKIISEIFNDYGILRRGKAWNRVSLKKIVSIDPKVFNNLRI